MDQIEFIVRQIERVNDKLDSITETAATNRAAFDTHAQTEEKFHDEIKATMATSNMKLGEYNEQLKEHIRRTEILEEKTDKLEKYVNSEKSTRSYKAGVVKKVSIVAGVLAGLASMVWSVIQLVEWLVIKF